MEKNIVCTRFLLLLVLFSFIPINPALRTARAADNAGSMLILQMPQILAAAASPRPLALSAVSYWGYQIQDVAAAGAVELLAASRYDMLILEPTRTDWSSIDKDFDTRAMVSRLKKSKAHDGIHRKLVLAYIDIGEAEDWRWYWDWSTVWDCTGSPPADWPGYILACDPDDWIGNYPVAFWEQEWKDLVIYGVGSDPANRDYISIIDEVIVDGFDGIYLDWVEAFEDATVMAAAASASKDPDEEMIAFIGEMRTYARLRNPGFLIIQQNAASLIDGHPELAGVIDAIAQEAIWYDGDADVDWENSDGYDFVNDPALSSYYLNYLADYSAAGLPVFACEYARFLSDTAYANALANQFIPYASRRALSRLTTTPPSGY